MSNVLNNAKKLYVGDREIKTINLQNKEVFFNYETVANFGSDFGFLEEEYTLPTTTLETDYIQFLNKAFPESYIFAFIFNEAFSFEPSEEYYIIASRTETSPVTALFDNSIVVRQGNIGTFEFYDSEFTNTFTSVIDSAPIGKNKTSIQINTPGSPIQIGALIFSWDGTSSFDTIFPFRLYEIVKKIK